MEFGGVGGWSVAFCLLVIILVCVGTVLKLVRFWFILRAASLLWVSINRTKPVYLEAYCVLHRFW